LTHTKNQNRTRQTIEEIIECPECRCTNLAKDYSRAEVVCVDCGLVLDEDIIDHGPEWRAFDSEQREKKSRVGAPMTFMLHDKGLSTTIGMQNRDSYGKSIPTKTRAQVYRLRKWQSRTRIVDGTERNLALALSALDRMASGLSLPRTVRETAALIYRKAMMQNLIRGRSIDGITAAVLYAACRQCHVPRTLDEISGSAHLPRKEIGRNYRYVAHALKLHLNPTTPQEYVSRFCSELKLSAVVQTKSFDLLKEATGEELTSGRGPTGLAAASLYIASVLSGEHRTQREIAEVSGVTEVTIRNRYKELIEKLKIENITV
jgi:transcription initiation factor TFIIB